MKLKFILPFLLVLTACYPCSETTATRKYLPIDETSTIVYEGESGPGKGKHIVFLASDHEYRSEETCPALARILAKRYGFRCTVVFGIDENGHVKAGSSHMPGTNVLEQADLMFTFLRFVHPVDAQMKPIDDYLNRAGPVIGLRTSTHAFNMKANTTYGKYNFRNRDKNYLKGFGRQVLGETWVSHYGHNHKTSVRMLIKDDQKKHPVNKGVKDMHCIAGAYTANPMPNSVILSTSTVLNGMKPNSPVDAKKKAVPGAWVRTYKNKAGKEGRVFATTQGASEDIVNDGFRRQLINAVFWTMGMEDEIKANMNIDFVGPYQPTTFNFGGNRKNVKPSDIKGWDTPIWAEPKK